MGTKLGRKRNSEKERKREKCGLQKKRYFYLQALHLTMDDSELDAKDKSYLSSKYTPLTVRLSEHIAKNKTWTGKKTTHHPTFSFSSR